MASRPPLLIFDVESIGLHGEGFAFGVILVEHGEVVEEALAWCHPDRAIGRPEDRVWIEENVLPRLVKATRTPTHTGPCEVREEFWTLWDGAREKLGAKLMGDVCWPVEANFLSACVSDDPQMRAWNGPYPLYDAGSLTLAGVTTAYESAEPHNPLEDARATWLSIRDWWCRG